MANVKIRTQQGFDVVCAPSLNSITTFSLLEQERWFEKEVAFFGAYLKPGMRVIDVGANVGVYALWAARLVGPEGRVFAYEPNPNVAALLREGVVANGFQNVDVSEVALSDEVGEAVLSDGGSSEHGAIATKGEGFPVALSTLDHDISRFGTVAMLKIDAEGAEENIIRGGHEFFKQIRPLVMFELHDGHGLNLHLVGAFEALGYRCFRQLCDPVCLVPLDVDAVDPAELNAFAVPTQRIAELQQARLLVDRIPGWNASAQDRDRARKFWSEQRQVRALNKSSQWTSSPAYADALTALAMARDDKRNLASRVAAQAFALATLRQVAASEPTVARQATLARVAYDSGQRAEALHAVHRLLDLLREGPLRLDEPFLPPAPQSDHGVPKDLGAWFVTGAMEQCERLKAYSACVEGDPHAAIANLEYLEQRDFVSMEMTRRRMLLQMRAGARPAAPERLKRFGPHNLNAGLWESGALSLLS